MVKLQIKEIVVKDPGDQTADDGRRYQLRFNNSYHFGERTGELTPLRTSAIAEGDRALVVGYPLASGEVRPEYVAVERDGAWQPVAYKFLFDLTREELDASLLARYPQTEPVELWLRGSLEQVLPFLVNEQGNAFAGEALVADSAQDVLVQGSLQPPFNAPRLLLETLFALTGGCVTVPDVQENCFYWQQIYPPPESITTITATVLEAVSEAGVLVLEQPVQGLITITLVPDGQLLTEDGTAIGWEDIEAGAQVQATGEVGEAGTLLAQEIYLVEPGE